MTELVRINDEVVATEDFIKLLKFGGRFESLLEDIVKDKVMIHEAKKAGVAVTDEEIQERSEQLRRVRGLHRASDTLSYLERLGVSVEDFETFIAEMLFVEKMTEQITREEALEEYFRLNSPRFDSVEISHLIVESEDMAREIVALLEDDPDMFEDLAGEHSVAHTKDAGGYIGMVTRGSVRSDNETKIFNAEVEEPIGPLSAGTDGHFEVFMVKAKKPATLDDETRDTIRRLVKEEWLAARAQENSIQAL